MGLCLPWSSRATTAATRPSPSPSASIQSQRRLPVTRSAVAVNVDILDLPAGIIITTRSQRALRAFNPLFAFADEPDVGDFPPARTLVGQSQTTANPNDTCLSGHCQAWRTLGAHHQFNQIQLQPVDSS